MSKAIAFDHSAFSLQRTPIPITSLTLRETHLLKLTRAFKDSFGGQGIFAAPEPVLIDLSGIENSGKWVDFPALVSLLRNYQLEPIAVLGGNAKQREQAALARLMVIEQRPGEAIEATQTPSSAAETVEQAAPPEPTTAAPVDAPAANPAEPQPVGLLPPMIVRHPVRSGAELYARQCDLVIMNVVSAGARIVADGSIYIHGALKGTAAAGISGMPHTRIFCESFEPEIIAINGIYLDGEQLAKHPAWGKRALIELNDEGQLDVRTFS
ncbi:septum site-determining protein MinC [Halothiobacillus diazotrophicus]|uniref:Probable septum site-determining protein MinC n=1 Tax=Halothiobacillus diazotrophicus TaxID=1860122 RepID=A0A191ZDY4_9GAMM|nr:septum site-determining protein MinC [Halothiobacillus diazotrophicus]ANJ66083.1 septum site-determining protein MinC [Halothiobacillus diazotrophicus]